MKTLFLMILSVGVGSTEIAFAQETFQVLVFSKTAGYRHASIPDGIAAIQNLGMENEFTVEATEDAAIFNSFDLARFQAVIFLSTTGDVLDAEQQAALEDYIRSGGGYVGIHAAADTEYDWPWYGELVGAWFQSHPAIQSADIKVADRVHPSTSGLPYTWTRTDEWYNFRRNPRGEVHVLATIDENSYSGGEDGFDHPVSWCRDFDGGRSWYTALGHTEASYSEASFLEHILGGILYAAGAVSADCRATLFQQSFEKVILDEDLLEPMELAVANDGRVFYIERGGRVKIYKPASRDVVVTAQLAVFTGNENGLMGIALDPNFDANEWLYLFYSPPGIDRQHLSRFTLSGDQLDLDSEIVVLAVPHQRETCCHSGGSLTFGPAGNLWLSLGDDTNPFDSDGYTPIDEQPGRSSWDAQRTSANTQDLRGSVLRIRPNADGTYSIPEGNLFPADGSAGRPEIYAMGCRNPFRISVDSETGWLYWGDVGPDAGRDNSNRGPRGYDEWNQARGPGFFGWPYFIADNKAYRNYDFATGTSGPVFDAANPVNNSPNNTGSTNLAAATPAWIWYPYGSSNDFPEITGGSGRTAMAGPVYHYDASLESATRLPAYYDKTLFIFEWSRNFFKEVKIDENGDILKINPFLEGFDFDAPMDMTIGPDGAIYVLEYGSNFVGAGTPKLARIDYLAGSRSPVAKATATPSAGPIPLAVSFSSEGSVDPDGEPVTLAWDFDGDGTVDSQEANPEFTYTIAGDYVAKLTVADPGGNRSSLSLPIIAGNSFPEVEFLSPANGGFYDWGESIEFDVTVSDAEDGSTATGDIRCDDVVVQPFLGHDEHRHPLELLNLCAGVFQVEAGHGDDGDNIFYSVESRYEDAGASGVSSLTGVANVLLQPKRMQAEHWSQNNGVQAEETGDNLGGGLNVGYIDDRDFISFSPMNLINIDFITYRVASAGPGGRIEVRVDAPEGAVISTAHVEPTGEWQVYRDVTAPITDPGGTNELFFVFKGSGDGLFNINWIDFHGAGVATLPEGVPDGLTATYFEEQNLSGHSVSRVEPMVNFNWADDAPIEGIQPDGFSARWQGFVVPESSGSYDFYARTTDGARLWVDDQLIIDDWTSGDVRERRSTSISLEAGQVHTIRMEYFSDGDAAQATLLWSTSQLSKRTVPKSVLYSENNPTSVADSSPGVPREFRLLPAYPNPFNPETTISFELPRRAQIRLEVFDILGRKVKTLHDQITEAGRHSLTVSAAGWPTGTYIIRLTTPDTEFAQKVLLLR